MNSSDVLLSNQIIDGVGLRDEVDGVVDDMVGPAPRPQPLPEGEGR
ncbi:hypothetical protein [Streptomyces goshikiensis]